MLVGLSFLWIHAAFVDARLRGSTEWSPLVTSAVKRTQKIEIETLGFAPLSSPIPAPSPFKKVNTQKHSAHLIVIAVVTKVKELRTRDRHVTRTMSLFLFGSARHVPRMLIYKSECDQILTNTQRKGGGGGAVSGTQCDI